MKMSRIGRDLVLVGLFLASLGCQKAPVMTARWPSMPGATGEPLPVALSLKEGNAASLRVGHETVLSRRVEVGGAYLRDSWVKNVRDDQNRTVYAGGRIHAESMNSVREKAESILKSRQEVLARLKRQVPSLSASTWVRGPELEFAPRSRVPGWKFEWLVDYLDVESDLFWRIHADQKGKVKSRESVGSNHVNVLASVFPKGPKASALEEVMLRELLDDGVLASAKTRVACSEDAALITWRKGDKGFQYPMDDHRFDAVQAYYYVDRAQAWFKERAALDLPFELNVDVFAGGIESPRNTACYYYGIIRLGAGDGKTYKHLMRDPSIVMHEVSHAVVEVISHLPTQEEGGSINEAFADYFSASILDSPRMAEASFVPGPFKRSLENSMSVREKNGGLYHDSLIMSGTLWDVRKVLGPENGLKFALKTLARLGPESNFPGFGIACRYALSEGWAADEVKAVEGILAQRGWGELPHVQESPSPLPMPSAARF